MEVDSGVGEGEEELTEFGGEGAGTGANGQDLNEFGGGTDPAEVGLKEGLHFIYERVRGRWEIEGGLHLERGGIEGAGGGLGPGEGAGVAGGGGGDGRGRTGGQGAGDRGAENAEDSGIDLLQAGGDLGFGAVGTGGKGREGNDEGAAGEVGGRHPILVHGKENGAFEPELEWFGGAGLAAGDAGAGGEAAEGGDDFGGQVPDVIEGEDPVLAGAGEEVAGRGGEGAKGEWEGSTRVRRVRAAKDLPQPVGPRRMRMGKGPVERRAERSQARQRSQSGPSAGPRLRDSRRRRRVSRVSD